MASLVGLTNGASHHQPAVDTAVGSLVEQLSRLRADIVAGKHSRFRVPEHLAAAVLSANPGYSVASSGKPLPVTATAPTFAPAPSNSNAFHSQPIVHQGNAAPALPGVLDPREAMQQRRQELESILEAQIHQKRQLSKQKPCDQEIIADFDVTETLRKAHERVKPWRPSDSTSANRSGSSSDSFDENTFYSSQMNESTTTEEIEPPKNPKRPLRACRFFRAGKECPYGEKCTFSHDPQVVKQIEAEEQQRATTKQDRANDHGNRRAASPARKPAAKVAAPEPPPVDPQAARIAELEAQLKMIKDQQRPPKPKIVPQAIERPDSEPSSHVDDSGRERSRRDQYKEDVQIVVRTPLPPPSDPNYSTEVDTLFHTLQPSAPIIRNHITTPYAPQPARVSPLAGAKPAQVVRLQRTYQDESAQSNGSTTDHGSARQSPTIAPQPKGNNRKRKRAQNAEENARNVATRTQNVQSPGVYIKEEPVSPPPLNAISRLQPVQPPQSDIRMVPTARVPSRVLPHVPQHEDDGRYVFEPLIEPEEPSTPKKRVATHNAPQFIARDGQDLRRVASTRNLRQQPQSPTFDAAYSDPQPRMVRAASTVQYVQNPKEPPLPPPQYRASVQPAFRDTRSQPRQIELTPDRPHVITMAPPPPRRIVVDEYGRQYEEVPAPPPEPQIPIPRYQSVAADGQVYRRAQPSRYEEPGRYVQRAGTPPSPQYVEYAEPSRKSSLVHVDQNAYEHEPYPPSSRVLRYAPQPIPGYDEVSRFQDERPRSQRMHVAEEQYEPPQQQVREPVSRMGSVRPQPPPRLVRLGENGEGGEGVVRQMSVRPEEGGYARQNVYQYAQPDGQIGGQGGGYAGGFEEGGGQVDVYDQGRGQSRRIMRI